MSTSTVINLRAAWQVDPGRWLTGPLKLIQLVKLEPTAQVQIAAQGAEHTLFTLHGTGTLTRGETTVALGPDVAVTLPLGTQVSVVAGPDGLEYFQASLDVPTQAGLDLAADTVEDPHDDIQGGRR